MVDIAFIDLETTGIPKQPSYDYFYDPKESKYYDDSRIVQITVSIYQVDLGADNDGKSKKLAEHDYIIKPEGFIICNQHIHHIDHNLATFAGITLDEAMALIAPDIKNCKLLIAHNIGFDKHVLLSELYRKDSLSKYVNIITSMSEFCTSKGCTELTKLPFKGNKSFKGKKYKEPKLNELHKFLFNNDAKDLHNSLNDTRVLVKCFFELMRIKYISITSDD